METKFSAFFVLFFVLIIAISSFYLKNEVIREFSSNEQKLTGAPEFFLKNFSSKQTKKDGNLKFIFSGNEMKSFKHADITKVKFPIFKKFENNIEHSLIISENADIINNGDQIILKDNVTLTRFPTKTRKQLKLFTSELNIFPNDDYVSSSQPIKIVQEPNIEINGVGMIYNKTENTFKILKKVTVYYEKPKK